MSVWFCKIHVFVFFFSCAWQPLIFRPAAGGDRRQHRVVGASSSSASRSVDSALEGFAQIKSRRELRESSEQQGVAKCRQGCHGSMSPQTHAPRLQLAGVVLLAQVAARAAWQTVPLVPARAPCRLPAARLRGGRTLRAAASFRTEVHAPRLPVDVKLADRLFFMGSCFSDNIGARLASLKFQVPCLRA